MKYYGWYSAHADAQYGHILYRDSNGLKIKITEAVREGQTPISKWNDLVYVGELGQFIESTLTPIKLNPSEEDIFDLYQKAVLAAAEQKRCQEQFVKTKKCFCYTCPVNNVN